MKLKDVQNIAKELGIKVKGKKKESLIRKFSKLRVISRVLEPH